MHAQVVSEWRTVWRTVPAWEWNEHHAVTVPPEFEWVLVGQARELDGTVIASMGFAVDEALMRSQCMDDFIDEIAFPELLDAMRKVRPVADVVVNHPGELVYGCC